MIENLIIGIIGIIGLATAWSLVQFSWRRTFADQIQDIDVLASRSSCGNCGCDQICQKNK